MIKAFSALIGVFLVGVAVVPAYSQTESENGYVLLSNDYGGRTYIGLPLTGSQTPPEPINEFSPKAMSGDQISDLFSRLCLTNLFERSAYDAALSATASDFKSSVFSLPDFSTPKPLLGSYKVPAVQFSQERSEYGIASLWLGDGVDGLTNRQYIRYSGGAIIIGPVKGKDFYAPQCNLTLRVAGLSSTKTLFDTIQTAVPSVTLTKRVEKPKYGSGVWTMPASGGRIARIFVDAVGLNKETQTVHMTVQMLPTGKLK